MSLFEDRDYTWRETCLVVFSADRRPTRKSVERMLRGLRGSFLVRDSQDDDEGRLECLTVVSEHDHAAMDICYADRDEEDDDLAPLLDELAKDAAPGDQEKLRKAAGSNARFDILHFERRFDDEDDGDFDPGSLLAVLGGIAKLVDGVGIDPQSGTLV